MSLFLKYFFSFLVSLLLLGCGGSNIITSVPSGAQIERKGGALLEEARWWNYGTTPETFPTGGGLAISYLSYRVSKEGYKTEYFSLKNSMTEDISKHLILRKLDGGKVNIDFSSIPDNSKVYLKNYDESLKYLGTTPFNFTKTLEYKETYKNKTFIAKKEGYLNSEKYLSEYSSYKNEGIPIHFSLKKIPIKIKIIDNITSEPKDAKIFQGKDEYSLKDTGFRTPHTFKHIGLSDNSNQMFYQVKKYNLINSDIVQSTDTNNNHYFKLNPIHMKIIDNITSAPEGARIFQGKGRYNLVDTGFVTPHTFKRNVPFSNSPEQMYYQAKKINFTNSNIIQSTDTNNNHYFQLEPLPTGTIKLTSNQKNVSIFLDGEYVGKITDKNFVYQLSKGMHTITAKKKLFGQNTIKIDMLEDDIVAHEFVLVNSGNSHENVGKSKIIQSIGELRMITPRNDLSIYLDGIKRTLPLKLTNIASGKYNATIVGPGINYKIQFIIEENKATIIKLDEYIK
jgi:hypothetical protein